MHLLKYISLLLIITLFFTACGRRPTVNKGEWKKNISEWKNQEVKSDVDTDIGSQAWGASWGGSTTVNKSVQKGYDFDFSDANRKADDNSIAIIIGNKNYRSLSGTISEVVFAHNDADAIENYVVGALGYREGNIIKVKDATQAKMISIFGNESSHIAKLYNIVKPGVSEIFVYYSGHGAPSLKDGKSYLVPVDADAATIELNGYALDLLYKNLSLIPARKITVVLDACFSGGSSAGVVIKNASSITLRNIEKPIVPSKINLLTASGMSEVASWDSKSQHGLFTFTLLKGLSGEADKPGFGDSDKQITLMELKRYLESEVPYNARLSYGRDQHPVISGDQGMVMAVIKAKNDKRADW